MGDPLVDCAGRFVTNLVRNLLFGLPLHPKLQYLPVLVCQIANKITKLLIGQPWNFHTLWHIVEILKTQATFFELHPYVRNDGIGQPPEREEPCLVGAASGNLTIISLALFHLEELLYFRINAARLTASFAQSVCSLYLLRSLFLLCSLG